MKFWLGILLCFCFSANCYPNHIAGGELVYKYVGRGGTNGYRYQFTLRLFRECSSTGQQLFTQATTVGIYDNATLTTYKTVNLHLADSIKTIAFTPSSIPCLLTNVDVCYQVAEYVDTVELLQNGFGYTAAWQACCRADSAVNISDTLSGSTYIAKMPGAAHRVNFNNLAKFVIKDTVVVCANKPFTLDFSAVDPDGDTLAYELSSAFNSGLMASGGNPPNQLFLTSLNYNTSFSGSAPIGQGTTMDPWTGKISGIAPPDSGSFVLNVVVTEIRRDLAIASHNKDFLIKVKKCVIVEADLKPSYSSCDDFKFQFQNEAPSPLIQSYLWDFGSGGNFSNLPTPTFAFPDTGTYKVKLIVKGPSGCVDTGFTNLHVYPKFLPDFTVGKACRDSVVQFKDATFSSYGAINSYKWNFGDTATLADTSRLKNATYLYDSTPGAHNVKLIVSNSNGCIDSITRAVNILDNPTNSLVFHDTTICKTDTLHILMNATGTYNWSPAYNIINPASSSPFVYPFASTKYYVSSVNNDCIAYDSVIVRVLNSITLKVGNDTTICLTDSIRLNTVSNGLTYLWTPRPGIDNPAEKSPVVSPGSDTRYIVESRRGHCYSTDSIVVKVAAYPVANAGRDTSICFGKYVQLNATAFGSPFTWSNTATLSDPGLLQPVATPQRTSKYILNVWGAPGCPKAVHDTVVVNVVPPLKVQAGNDTMILQGTPLTLQASSSGQGAITYSWYPSTGLSNSNIYNPVFMLSAPAGPLKYIVKGTTKEGCVGEDEMNIMVFANDADIYVPSAFTPNNDGNNDNVRAIPVGIASFNYFSIYNRYGQMVFHTKDSNRAWDGLFNNKQQPSGTYIFATSGFDIRGKVVSKKGTILLIR